MALGAMSTKSKAQEADNSVLDGADEIDMVINIGVFKDKKFDIVKNDIAMVVKNLFRPL